MLNANIDPAFPAPLFGLKRLDSEADKRHYAEMINNFKEIVPNQPPFLIKKESWNMLAEGKHPNGTDWKNANLEVYGFVFCVAFDQRTIVASKLGKLKLVRSKHATPTAYFRIRTLLKDRNVKNEGSVPILVETELIAYVSLNIALSNQSKPREEWKDCLKFNTTANSPERVRIDNDVFRKPKPNESIDLKTKNILDIFITPKSQARAIENEGSIFGKEGIWDTLLSFSGQYNFQKDTLISLAWDEQKGIFSFDFKINDEYVTELPCPNPPICNLE